MLSDTARICNIYNMFLVGCNIFVDIYWLASFSSWKYLTIPRYICCYLYLMKLIDGGVNSRLCAIDFKVDRFTIEFVLVLLFLKIVFCSCN